MFYSNYRHTHALVSKTLSVHKILVFTVFFGSTYAQAADETESITLTTQIVTPVSINCGTSLDFGDISILEFNSLDGSFLFHRPGQTLQGSALQSSFVNITTSGQLGECTVSNVPDPSTVSVGFTSSTIDISNSQGSTLPFDLFLRDIENSQFAANVSYTIDSANSVDPTDPATTNKAVEYTANTLTFQVGGSLEFDFSYNSQNLTQGQLVGAWTGSATVEVTL